MNSKLREILERTHHRVGSHSDDWGGDSDKPCYCEAEKAIRQAVAEEMLGLVGDDMPIGDETERPYTGERIYNKRSAELRQKIKEYGGLK